MDDLAGLSFTTITNSSSVNPKPPPISQSEYSMSNYTALRPAPPSSTNTPQPRGTSPANGASKPVTPDSFANLLNFGRNSNASNNAATNLSLQEQQRMLQEAKMKAEEEKRRQMDREFGDSSFWDTLGGRGGSSAEIGASAGGGKGSLGFNAPKPQVVVIKNKHDDEDLFAAFKAEAPVDMTSHFPPPASGATSTVVTPRFGTPNPPPATQRAAVTVDLDDPFDLMNVFSRGAASTLQRQSTATNDDDDFLGLLGKPVSELPPKPPVEQPSSAAPLQEQGQPVEGDPRDAAIAELMDMGFSLAQSRKALAETDTGLDIQQAVGWLLNEAHRHSLATSSLDTPVGQRDRSRDKRHRKDERRGPSTSRRRDGSEPRQPAWARESGGGTSGGEKDITAIASEVGSKVFKQANSLWSVGKKKMEKAMKELQQAHGGDSAGGEDMPKWMRDAQMYQREEEDFKRRRPGPDSRGVVHAGRREVGDHEGRATPPQSQPELLTDEALMLQADSLPPRKSAAARSSDRAYPPYQQHQPPSRGQSVSPLPPSQQARPSPAELQKQKQLDFAEQIRKKEIELRAREAKIAAERNAKLGRGDLGTEEEVEAYISPARRRGKASPGPAPVVQEGNLVGAAGMKAPERDPFQQQQMSNSPSPAPPPKRPTTSSPPIAIRKSVPQRPPVPVSSGDFSRSTQSRQKGTEAFKLGDYAQALTHYTSALSALPDTHLLRTVILCNRALCNLKVGDAKACLTDCEEALGIIGEGRGEGEALDVDTGEKKQLVGFWEKAMARKAEGLEALEKWAEAGKVWGSLVEAGKGGGNALKGRSRCENAARLKVPPAAAIPVNTQPQAKRPPPARPSSFAPAATQQSEAAVRQLRQAHATAEAVEAEKLSLYDSVSERINTWKKGKEGNLRALLTSLDQILWEGSGWAKVTMGQLVIPRKVKVVYMKGIARVHPDKIPKDATTEQRMVCGTVFSLLNEAWDKFKVENNL